MLKIIDNDSRVECESDQILFDYQALFDKIKSVILE